jgi:hypothetical protein
MSKRLANNLKRRASAWAGQLTSLAKSFAPNHVEPAISSKVETKEDGTYTIRITADRRIAPDARAQEFGSGLHARRGVKKKYVIAPKYKKVLAFHWDVLDNPETAQQVFDSPKFLGFAPDGRGLFRYVEHPGIQAANAGKGYIAPAMRELRKRAKADLSKEIKDAIVGDLRESFGRKSK